jgi:hypothetical protein
VRWTEILITRWAGPCSLPLDFWARWMAFGPFSHVWSTMDHQCCWALGLWWITGVLDLVRGGLEKIGLYTYLLIFLPNHVLGDVFGGGIQGRARI